jgi:hypothetical protein
MTFAWTIVVLVVLLAIAWRYLGSYMAAVFEGRARWLAAVERPIYRVIGVSPEYQAAVADRDLELTPREFEFIAFLARHAGKVCTRRMILENVWGPGYASEASYLKVYAYRIRRKLGDDEGRFLQSDPAVGYRLAIPGEA